MCVGTERLQVQFAHSLESCADNYQGVVSSGYSAPMNMLSLAGTTAFLEVYLAYLRVLGDIVNVDIVNISVEHAFANAHGLVDNGPEPPTSIPESLTLESIRGSSIEGGEESTTTIGEMKSTRGSNRDATITADRDDEMLGDLARTIWEGMEGGGIATIGWPARKYMMANAARGA